MPTVLRIGPYRFYFFSSDCSEPPHIHVEASAKRAKFWLQPVELSWSRGFSPRELNVIEGHINDNLQTLLDAWNEHCKNT